MAETNNKKRRHEIILVIFVVITMGLVLTEIVSNIITHFFGS